jgi:hypothetical protein
MECFGPPDFDDNSRLITLSAIIISGLHCIVRFSGQVESEFVSNVHCMLAGHTSQRAVSVASPLYFNYDAVIVQRLARFVTAVARAVYTACPSHHFTPCLCNKILSCIQLTAVKFPVWHAIVRMIASAALITYTPK